MVTNGQRSIYGVKIQLHQQANIPYKLNPNTTLNDKFNLHPKRYRDELPGFPTLKYYCIGIGGNAVIYNTSGYSYNQHRPTDASLFHQIPFIIREVNNDLSLRERKRYRFRIYEEIDGRPYYSYYLKTIPIINISDSILEVQNTNNTEILKTFNTNVSSVIDPIPIDKARRIEDYEIKDMRAVVAKADLGFELLEEELQEIKKVIEIKKLDRDIITEIGVCTGLEEIEYQDYVEPTAVQIAYFYTLDINLTMYLEEKRSVNRTLEIGGMEPMLI